MSNVLFSLHVQPTRSKIYAKRAEECRWLAVVSPPEFRSTYRKLAAEYEQLVKGTEETGQSLGTAGVNSIGLCVIAPEPPDQDRSAEVPVQHRASAFSVHPGLSRRTVTWQSLRSSVQKLLLRCRLGLLTVHTPAAVCINPSNASLAMGCTSLIPKQGRYSRPRMNSEACGDVRRIGSSRRSQKAHRYSRSDHT
jgi:hypothetical protein